MHDNCYWVWTIKFNFDMCAAKTYLAETTRKRKAEGEFVASLLSAGEEAVGKQESEAAGSGEPTSKASGSGLPPSFNCGEELLEPKIAQVRKCKWTKRIPPPGQPWAAPQIIPAEGGAK